MKHFFDVYVAKTLGINSAILLENLYFWIKKNEANKKHYYDGKYWTYNSVEAFTKLFPYFSYDSIRYSLEKLEKAGYIITGNYNPMPMDKTKWYALTEKAYSLLDNSQMDLGFFPDGNGDNTRAIPDNKPDNEKKESKKEAEAVEETYDQIIDREILNPELREIFRELMKMRAFIKKPITTNKALVRMINRLHKFAQNDNEIAIAILDQSIRNNWQDIYQLKEDYSGKKPSSYKSTAISKKWDGNTAKDADGKEVVY